MCYPWANTLLLLLLLGQLLTSLGDLLLSGADNFSWVLWLHGVGGYALRRHHLPRLQTPLVLDSRAAGFFRLNPPPAGHSDYRLVVELSRPPLSRRDEPDGEAG